jgi:hypothetical protein
MGYNTGTANSLDVLALQLARMAQTAENSGRVTGTESNQTTIKLKAVVEALQVIVENVQSIQVEQGKILSRLSSPRAGSATTGGTPVSIGSSWSDYAPVSFAVPAECEKVAIIGVSSAYLGAGGTSGNASWLRVAINSSMGQQIGAAAIDMVASTSVAHAAVLDVSPGASVTVRAQARTDVAGSSALITTAALIIFL